MNVSWLLLLRLFINTSQHENFYNAVFSNTFSCCFSISALPAELPQIDFNAYKSKIVDKKFVDSVQAEVIICPAPC